VRAEQHENIAIYEYLKKHDMEIHSWQHGAFENSAL
jgi:hypothetical protein